MRVWEKSGAGCRTASTATNALPCGKHLGLTYEDLDIETTAIVLKEFINFFDPLVR